MALLVLIGSKFKIYHISKYPSISPLKGFPEIVKEVKVCKSIQNWNQSLLYPFSSLNIIMLSVLFIRLLWGAYFLSLSLAPPSRRRADNKCPSSVSTHDNGWAKTAGGAPGLSCQARDPSSKRRKKGIIVVVRSGLLSSKIIPADDNALFSEPLSTVMASSYAMKLSIVFWTGLFMHATSTRIGV